MKKMSFRMNQLAFGVLALVCLGAAPAFGQTWIGTVSDLWFTAGNWSPGTVPNSGSAVVTISNATNNPVILNSSATISTLTMGSASSLDVTGGVWSIAGTSIANTGSISLSTQMQLANSVTLSGAGSLTMVAGQMGTNGGAQTLSNSSTILGSGFIGSNSGALSQNLSLNNSGTIDANSSGNTLQIEGTGVTTNTNLLEATGGGILNITSQNAVDNAGGTITASGSGSAVEITNDTVQGGTLTHADQPQAARARPR